ncbi:ribonuclease TUDOR 1-like protein [Tanacetum coccineum]
MNGKIPPRLCFPKVVEVVSGDCIIIADDTLSFGSPAVQVSMEYSRKVHVADGSSAQAGSADTRVMGFGSVFLLSEAKGSEDVNSTTATPPAASTQQPGLNVTELIIARGFGTVIRHREFEERSNHYENLLASESCATTRRKGIHSAKDPPSMHVTDLLAGSAKKAKYFLPFLQRKRRMTVVVEYVLSGHRFKLFVPKETCSIAFSLFGVRCPGLDESYSNDAISLMRRKIMQRDVEIEVETVDRIGTFIGSLWESKTNVGTILLEGRLGESFNGLMPKNDFWQMHWMTWTISILCYFLTGILDLTSSIFLTKLINAATVIGTGV